MTFLGETEHFSGKNGTLSWSILVGKQKHNVQMPRKWSLTTNEIGSKPNRLTNFIKGITLLAKIRQNDKATVSFATRLVCLTHALVKSTVVHNYFIPYHRKYRGQHNATYGQTLVNA